MSTASPIAPPAPKLRADALRNRRKILRVADALLREGGAQISMDNIATRAGVGKGTIYRGFGDKAGLAEALLDERERELQDGVLRGPPPLGPGASPEDRAVAFVDQLTRLTHEHGQLHLLAQGPGKAPRYGKPLYGFYRQHLELLIREASDQADAEVLAHCLLACVSAELVRYLTEERGVDLTRLSAALTSVVQGTFASLP